MTPISILVSVPIKDTRTVGFEAKIRHTIKKQQNVPFYNNDHSFILYVKCSFDLFIYKKRIMSASRINE